MTEPALIARVGNEPGASFRLKFVGSAAEPTYVDMKDPRANVRELRVSWFTSAILAFGGNGKLRVFLLEPDVEDNEFVFGSFFIRGKYRVTEKINNPRAAAEAYKDFSR